MSGYFYIIEHEKDGIVDGEYSSVEAAVESAKSLYDGRSSREWWIYKCKSDPIWSKSQEEEKDEDDKCAKCGHKVNENGYKLHGYEPNSFGCPTYNLTFCSNGCMSTFREFSPHIVHTWHHHIGVKCKYCPYD